MVSISMASMAGLGSEVLGAQEKWYGSRQPQLHDCRECSRISPMFVGTSKRSQGGIG